MCSTTFYTIAILYSKDTNSKYVVGIGIGIPICFKIESQNCPISSGYQKSCTL